MEFGTWTWIVGLAIAIVIGAVYDKLKERRARRGWLYFIGNSVGPVKIGITRGDPKERCRDLQTGNPTRLKVIHQFYVDNPEQAEGYAHLLLQDWHEGGEWYDRDAALALAADLAGDNVVQFPSKQGA